MEEKLQDLKQSMDRSIFNRKRFTEKTKLFVFKSVGEKEKRKHGTWNSKKLLNYISFSLTLTASLILIMVYAFPGAATLFESSKFERPADENYLVFDGYYYVPTDNSTDKLSLTDKLGEVKRIGYSNLLKDGDTGDGANYYVGESYYKMNDYPDLEYIAIEIFDSKVKEGKGDVIKYEVLKRDKPIEEIDENRILGAKNDPNEVENALNNIKKQVPFTYEIQTDKLNATLVSLDNDGKLYKITLYYENVNNKNSKLFIEQYQSGYVDKLTNQNSPVKIAFEVNGVSWKEYNDGTFIGTKDDIIFEIKGQKMSSDEIKSYLPLLKN